MSNSQQQQPQPQQPQPQQQQQSESSFSTGMKATFGVLFALFLLGVVIPCMTCGGCTMCAGMMGSAGSSFDAGSSGTSSGTSEKVTTFDVGETFSLGKFAYMVDSVETAGAVGSSVTEETPGQGATFVIVHFVIRNDGKKTETVLTNDFQIEDAQGRTFRRSSAATTAYATANDGDLILSELQPGVQKPAATVFEVPEGVVKQPFDIVVPEKGFLKQGKAVVEVQPEDVEK